MVLRILHSQFILFLQIFLLWQASPMHVCAGSHVLSSVRRCEGKTRSTHHRTHISVRWHLIDSGQILCLVGLELKCSILMVTSHWHQMPWLLLSNQYHYWHPAIIARPHPSPSNMLILGLSEGLIGIALIIGSQDFFQNTHHVH